MAIAHIINLEADNYKPYDTCRGRGTTTYLVQRRIDMLPKPLTEDICSLRAQQERLAFSVLWEIDGDARVVSVRFTKSVIKCACAHVHQFCCDNVAAALGFAEVAQGIAHDKLRCTICHVLRPHVPCTPQTSRSTPT
jgi:exoribonuclease II